MARMFPYPMNPDTASHAERKLYAALHEQLPDEYGVFHSVCWQVRNTAAGVQDGETDFVIAHVDYGILLVEVKGGRIRYDGHSGTWYSNDKVIKDPFQQGRNGKYSLLSKLKEIPYWRDRWVTIGYAAAFPDVVVKGDLRLDAPREFILDASDMTDLLGWVRTALQHLQRRAADHRPLGQAGMTELANLLSPSWDLRNVMGAEIAAEQREFLRLTQEQFRLLEFLGRQRRVAISGCAGSGKTTLAMEKTRRLAQQGFRVLLTCYNVNLAEFLRSDETLPSGVDVANFHRVASDLVRSAGLRQAGPVDDRFFDETLPELMVEAIDRLGTQYDAIIVDEGQDFRDNWWIPLQYLLHDPDHGIFYVFFDDNQGLYQSQPVKPVGLATFGLTRNCRNTQHIHKTVMQFYRSDQTPLTQGPPGRQVIVQTYNSPLELKQLLRRNLHQLVNEEEVPSRDIVVLTPKGRARSNLWRLGALGNFVPTDQWSAGSHEVYCSTIHSFKGLESPVVILAEIEPGSAQELEALLYVGCSRACNHLIVLASADLAEGTKEKLTT